MTTPLHVFISYSHNALDRPLLDELRKHLAPLQLAENPLIKTWDDADILPGEAWDNEIKQSLRKADIVFLLVSADFNHSRYIQEIELKAAIQRHQCGECKVVPIYLRPCDFEGMPYAGLEMLPKVPGTQRLEAVTNKTHWPDADLAFTEIVRRLRQLVAEIHQQKANHPAPFPPAPTGQTDLPPAFIGSPALSDLERRGYEQQLTIATQKLQRLQTALLLETDPSRQFAYEYDIQKLEILVADLKTKLQL